MAPAPVGVRLFTWQVGFGDCFLLRFEYADRPRHVLIDFGSTAAPKRTRGGRARQPLMLEVAQGIARTCRAGGGTLDAIVVTHRHQDHLSGFTGKPWEVLAALKPRLVVQPWTEHPDASPDAADAPTTSAGRLAHRAASHRRSLLDMQSLAASSLRELEARGAPASGAEELSLEVSAPLDVKPFSRELGRRLAFLGENNLANLAAVRNLQSVPARDYLHAGQRTRLSTLLPGVKVHVLGPPSLAQSDAIRGYAGRSDEYWAFAASAASRSARGARLFPRVKPVRPGELPLETRWFLGRLDAVRGEQVMNVVRHLDSVLNNTSLILAFEVGGKTLLFPGDAQAENWAWALSQPEVRELLAGVDVYKVGHHGSLNATPKSLWRLFRKKGRGNAAALRSFLSTLSGKHGSPRSGTEVPRQPLLEALQKESHLTSTEGMPGLVHEEQLL